MKIDVFTWEKYRTSCSQPAGLLYTHPQKPRTSIKLFYIGHIQPTCFNIRPLWKYICYVSCPSKSGIMKNKWNSIIATMVQNSKQITLTHLSYLLIVQWFNYTGNHKPLQQDYCKYCTIEQVANLLCALTNLTQPPTLSGMKNKYQPMGDDALRMNSKGRQAMFGGR